LQQILYNFLSNAIKFAPSNSVVTISTNKVTLADESTAVIISVRDRGSGIPEDMMDVLFEKFRQIDTITITDATPKTIPRLVNTDRSACKRRLFRPSRIVSIEKFILASTILVSLEQRPLELEHGMWLPVP